MNGQKITLSSISGLPQATLSLPYPSSSPVRSEHWVLRTVDPRHTMPGMKLLLAALRVGSLRGVVLFNR